MTQLYSLLKASEGGVSQARILDLLKRNGIAAKPGYSPYVGHYGVEVLGNKKVQAKVSNLLFRP